MRVLLNALLPAPDGTGWYALNGSQGHRCSTRGCEQMAVAYHHALLGSTWRNRYCCPDHMDGNLSVVHGRVWVNNA